MFFSQAGEFLGRRSIAFYCQVTSTVYRKRTGPPPAPPQVLACGQELYQLFELLRFNRSDKPGTGLVRLPQISPQEPSSNCAKNGVFAQDIDMTGYRVLNEVLLKGHALQEQINTMP